MSETGNPRPDCLFPLVRHFSYWTTKFLYLTPVTPNHITAVSLIFGMASAWMFLDPGYLSGLTGATLLLLCYVLDNSDGEIARMKKLSSDFGQRFDTFVDWVVHAALFLALGYATTERTGQDIWLWCGLLAAVGGTINYALDTLREASERVRAEYEARARAEAETRARDAAAREAVELELAGVHRQLLAKEKECAGLQLQVMDRNAQIIDLERALGEATATIEALRRHQRSPVRVNDHDALR